MVLYVIVMAVVVFTQSLNALTKACTLIWTQLLLAARGWLDLSIVDIALQVHDWDLSDAEVVCQHV